MKLEDKILWIIGILCFVIFCVSGFLLLDYYLESHKQHKMNEDLARLKHGYTSDTFIVVEALPMEGSVSDSPADQHKQPGEGHVWSEQENEQVPVSLSSINPDYVFWLQILNTEIDYPVVYRDNDYYLRRDFYGEKNKHGTIFLDVSCQLEDDFFLLHGHNMKDGTMFGSLRKYKDKEFCKEHGSLELGYSQNNEYFQIVAAITVDLYDPNRFVYEELPRTEEEAYAYLENIKKYAHWSEEFTWEPGKRVVLLSTCDYGSEEERFVVIAVEK